LEQTQAVLKLDERVAAVLHRLNVPTHDDVAHLQNQLEALNAQLTALIAMQQTAPTGATSRPEDETKDE
jgi:hypothetical protein